jgi:hypothetical protein
MADFTNACPCAKFWQKYTSSASRASAQSTEGLPGERLFTPFSSPPPCRSFIGAALQPSACKKEPLLQKVFDALGEAQKTALDALLSHKAVHRYVTETQRPEVYRLQEAGQLYKAPALASGYAMKPLTRPTGFGRSLGVA